MTAKKLFNLAVLFLLFAVPSFAIFGSDRIIFIHETATRDYAEMWNYSDSGTTVSIPASGVYYNISVFVPGELSGITFNESKLNISRGGTYSIDWAVSFSGGGNNDYGFGLSVNGDVAMLRHCYARRTTSTAGAIGSVSGTCIHDLDAGDVVAMIVDDEMNPAANIKIYTANLNLRQIKGR